MQQRGSRQPFFCVPTADHPLEFRNLAQHLGPDQPFYSFQAQDQDKEQTAPLSIEDTAAFYVREVREIQPVGPYFLGGFCFGGVVAFEMARQLSAQGQDVALVAIMEKSLPNFLKRSLWGRLYLYKRKLRHLGLLGYLQKKVKKVLRKKIVRSVAYRKVRKGTKRIVRTGRRAVHKSLLRFRYHLRHAFRNKYCLDQSERRDANSQGQPTWKRKSRAVNLKANDTRKPKRRATNPKAHDTWRRKSRALNSYEAQPYAGQLTLFQTVPSKSFWMRHKEPYAGWDRVAAGGVEVHEVPGGHQTIIKEPHVQVLAARLKTCLEQAQTSSS
jgi:thioesterase domain-containing protein